MHCSEHHFICGTRRRSGEREHLTKNMENFWMYQVEKLEEEEAKRKERTEKREEDEVEMKVWALG